MFKRINQQLVAHRKRALARRDNRELLALDDFTLRDIGISRHEILAILAE